MFCKVNTKHILCIIILLTYQKRRCRIVQLCERLRILREKNELTQKQLAERLMIRQQQYSEYERGKREIPVHYLVEIARIFGTSMDYIVGLNDDINRHW